MKLYLMSWLLSWLIVFGGVMPAHFELPLPAETEKTIVHRDRTESGRGEIDVLPDVPDLPDPVEPETADRPPVPVEAPAVSEHIPVYDAEIPATCETEGKSAGYHCDVCQAVLQTQLPLPKKGHDWGAWTEVDDTHHSRVCAHDPDHVETEGHSHCDLPGKGADCTTSGHTGGSYCPICGAITEAGEEIPALGHDFGEWKAAEQGHIKACSRCGDLKEASHSFGEPDEEGFASCGVCDYGIVVK